MCPDNIAALDAVVAAFRAISTERLPQAPGLSAEDVAALRDVACDWYAFDATDDFSLDLSSVVSVGAAARRINLDDEQRREYVAVLAEKMTETYVRIR